MDRSAARGCASRLEIHGIVDETQELGRGPIAAVTGMTTLTNPFRRELLEARRGSHRVVAETLRSTFAGHKTALVPRSVCSLEAA